MGLSVIVEIGIFFLFSYWVMAVATLSLTGQGIVVSCFRN